MAERRRVDEMNERVERDVAGRLMAQREELQREMNLLQKQLAASRGLAQEKLELQDQAQALQH